jgi:hypothetical protein
MLQANFSLITARLNTLSLSSQAGHALVRLRITNTVVAFAVFEAFNTNTRRLLSGHLARCSISPTEVDIGRTANASVIHAREGLAPTIFV